MKIDISIDTGYTAEPTAPQDFDKLTGSERAQWVPLQDQSAAQAIAQLKGDEAFEDFEVIWIGPTPPWQEPGCFPIDPGFNCGYPEPGFPGSGYPEPTFPPPYLPEPWYPFPVFVPTDNQLTGQELTGYLLEGVMDKGGELNELQQFQALRNDPGVKPDAAAQRVLDVVDRWVAFMQATGQTELSPDQKAQLTAELTEAAKPQFSILPWEGPQIILNDFGQ